MIPDKLFSMTKLLFSRLSQVAVLLIFMIPMMGYSVQVEDIYLAQVPVSDQSEAARDMAVKEGLSQVLVKVSGSSLVLQQAGVQKALARARRYVSEVGYSKIVVPGSDQPVSALSVRYAQPQVDRLLRREQLQVWPASRPELLVWLVIDTADAGKHFLEAEQYPEMARNLEFHMARRSAPLRWPLLDLQDRLAVPVDQAWQFNDEVLKSAAARYESENWLVIRLYQTSQGEWRGTSWLNSMGKTRLQGFAEPEVEALIARAVDHAVDNMAANYAFIPQLRDEPVVLLLENIVSFNDFNNVRAYLEALEVVREVKIQSVESDRLSLQLLVDGDVQLLLDTLLRDPRFSEVESYGVTAVNQYRFRWSSR